ncbi:Uncharacterised protein [Janthinobacterium lividum]|uniref:hypothetical protein n=1 Tax=Janthinobacterium lividum TaxID=29581 RepID=UPI000E07DBEB|nr:hypothetical protein [Janthinobacterium lividum]STR26105.1 Uncharacterised protein [Janthinobacterium lividum]
MSYHLPYHLPVLASCLATLLVGCGSDSDSDSTSGPPQSSYLETYRPQLSYTAAKTG